MVKGEEEEGRCLSGGRQAKTVAVTWNEGSLIGQILYIIGSDDAGEDAMNVKENLVDYNVWYHVPSDIAIGERFLA